MTSPHLSWELSRKGQSLNNIGGFSVQDGQYDWPAPGFTGDTRSTFRNLEGVLRHTEGKVVSARATSAQVRKPWPSPRADTACRARLPRVNRACPRLKLRLKPTSGRRWDGLHRHLALAMLTYSFLMRRAVCGTKRQLAYPGSEGSLFPLQKSPHAPSGTAPDLATICITTW